MIDAADAALYDDRPTVLAFADSPAAGARAATMAEEGDVTLVAHRLADAPAVLRRQVAVDLVLIEAEDDDASGPLEAALAAVAEGVTAGRFRAIAVVPPSALDLADARLGGGEAALLVAPSPRDRSDAVVTALRPRSIALEDVGKEGGLTQLREEVERLARAISGLVPAPNEAAAPSSLPPNVEPGRPHAKADAHRVRALIRARRLRDQFFEPALFADPAWDMLLDLFAARLEERRVAVSSLCIAAAVPPTTALRWMRTLTDAGLFLRVADPQDGRRVFIELAEGATAAMRAYLAAVTRAAPAVV